MTSPARKLPDDDEILTVDEVAAALRLARSTVVQMCAAGKIPTARKTGRQWRILGSGVRAIFFGHADLQDTERNLAGPGVAPRDQARLGGKGDKAGGRTVRGRKKNRAAHVESDYSGADRAKLLKLWDGGI